MDAFDLNRFAPPADVTFRLRKHGDREFRVDADPDVDDIARMLRIENVVRSVEDGDIQSALIEGKEILVRMVQERDPDFDGELRIGAQDLTAIFALILHGSTVAEAVMEAIIASSSGEDDGEMDEPGDDLVPPDGDDRGGGAPLRSPELSSERSSSSDVSEVGLLATGTA